MPKISLFVIIVVLMLTSVTSLYEDQIGKFDWRQQFVGRPRFVLFDQSGQKNLIVGTEKNVLACISARNGEIAWRQVLEEGSSGRVDGIHQTGTTLVSLTGGHVARAWSASTGHLLWELLLQQDPANSGLSVLAAKEAGTELLVAVHGTKVSGVDIVAGILLWSTELPHSSSHQYRHVTFTGEAVHLAGRSANSVVMTTINYDGKVASTNLVAGLGSDQVTCSFISGSYLACGDNSGILRYVKMGGTEVLTLPLGTQGKIVSIHSESVNDVTVVTVAMDTGHVVLELKSGRLSLIKVLEKVTATTFLLGTEDGGSIVALSRRSSEDVLLENYRVDMGKMEADGEIVLHIPEHHGQPQKIYGLAYKKRDSTTGYRYLVLCEDHSILMLTQTGKAAWIREEALSSILSVEMVDLPVSETDQKIEDEFGSPDNDVVSMFRQRIMTQLAQLQLLFEHVKEHLRGTSPQVGGERDAEDEVDQTIELTRDRFNLQKIIVVVTSVGKVFGMYSQTGGLVWKKYFSELEPFTRNSAVLPVILQRSTVHYPHPAQCLVLGRHKTSQTGYLVTFNPITGEVFDSKNLGYSVKQLLVMSHVDEQFLKGVVLLDTNFKIHVYPARLESLLRQHAHQYYFHSADPDQGQVQGYSLMKDQQNQLIANPVFNVNLMKDNQRITNVVSKRANEHVHSQGRVLADRNVLYKYLNPNLVVITAQGSDPAQKTQGFLNVYLVDAVSGSIVFHVNHKRVSGDVHVVHSENWVVYNYWNQKSRRFEMTVLELYEGHKQANSTVFSSLEPPPAPLVMRQAYIFPTKLTTMSVTMTEKGITNKHLLVALQMGGILELPMAFLDPRRPIDPTPEHREEGIIPYIPELAIQTDAIINYNKTVVNIRGIYTGPAGLESTSLVFAYGLDLFFTRVFPSKMFDVLKDDFDYLFISSVVIGMVLVSVISQKLAARKALHRNWK